VKKHQGTAIITWIVLICALGLAIYTAHFAKDLFFISCIVVGSLISGITLGFLYPLLTRRMRLGPDPNRVTKDKVLPIGTRLRTMGRCFRYASAGEDLKKGTLVGIDPEVIAELQLKYPNLLPRDNPLELRSDVLYCNLKHTTNVDESGTYVVGWPLVNVKRGELFWAEEVPPGSKFVEEGR